MEGFNRKMYNEGKEALRNVIKCLEADEYLLSEPAIIIDCDKETVLYFESKYEAGRYCESQYSEKNGNDLEVVLFFHQEDTKYTFTYKGNKFYREIDGARFYRLRKRVTFFEYTQMLADI